MKQINCTTSNCEHNIKQKCLAGVVTVGENARCMSRMKREGGALAQNFADIEAGGDIYENDLESLVQCSAPCIFNSNGLCANEQIEVKDATFQTKCRSFKKK